MIDFHSHVLPGIDDGSRSTEESLALLRTLREQSVDTVFMTPHFDAMHDTPELFLRKRSEALDRLTGALPADEGFPRLRVGAEVMYFYGIERMEALPALCLEGTRLLLMEMPVAPWSELTVKELIHLSCRGDMILMLAHIERYFDLQKPIVWERLLDAGVLMQINASFLTRPQTRRRALRMLRRGEAHLLGSDCHNCKNRPPLLGEAQEILCRKLGEDFFAQLNAFSYDLINN